MVSIFPAEVFQKAPTKEEGGLEERLRKLTTQSKVMLFMKGSPQMPNCGFSATVVQILNQVGAPFGSFNILADPEMREGLKTYSSWPTFPQLYVDGQLIGGCDIVREMHSSGQLEPLLKAAATPAG